MQKISIQRYLLLYNFFALLAWICFSITITFNQFKLNEISLLLLTLAQGIAFLEILHSLLKLVPSSVLVTAPQILSRLLVLVLINYFFIKNEINILTEIGIYIISIAWAITETVRYSHYLLSLLNKQKKNITFLRYSTFIILYPLGIVGEWCIFLTPFYKSQILVNFYSIAIVITFVLYIIFFPKLYKHLWQQRKQRLLQY